MTPSLSVILPVYNRAELLVHPLRSLRAAAAEASLEWEIIVVDDGSTEDIAGAVAAFPDLPIRLRRQEVNGGLLAARLAGLAAARHDAVLFLDADDLVAPGKFTRQLEALAAADVAYGDTGRVNLDAAGPAPAVRLDRPAGACADPAVFYLRVQPAPHNPIFRRDYLAPAVAAPLCPPRRAYDPVAETWFYYQLSFRPARIAYVPGAWSIVGEHGGERLSRAWERQAWGALQLMQAFLAHCPVNADTEAARRQVGVCAFNTWRALPTGFDGFPADAFLEVWRRAPRASLRDLGGPGFRALARGVGPVRAGRWLRRLRRPAYARIRTLSPEQLAALTRE